MNLIFHDLLGIIIEVYIDDIVVKSAILFYHLANLCLAFERMCHLSAGKFLGFIIYENDIEIDPKKIEVIQKV
jgi:hypothetical protein